MGMSAEFRDHLLDLLAPLGPVRAKRMFGGGGLYLDGTMFAIVADDVLYLKADDGNRGDFEARGLPPFRYSRGGREFALSYHEAPPDLLDDADDLAAWARKAWEAARRSGTGGNQRKARQA